MCAEVEIVKIASVGLEPRVWVREKSISENGKKTLQTMVRSVCSEDRFQVNVLGINCYTKFKERCRLQGGHWNLPLQCYQRPKRKSFSKEALVEGIVRSLWSDQKNKNET